MVSAYGVVAQVVQANRFITEVTLVAYGAKPTWRDRRKTRGRVTTKLMVEGLDQDQGERLLLKIPRRGASAESLTEIACSLKSGTLLGLSSLVRLRGGDSAHIPMMDFTCAPSIRNLKLLGDMLQELRLGIGYVLVSGRSYHYYGLNLLTEEQWRIFLGRCLLMTGFSDDRYIGHQLVDGHCVLRLSPTAAKSGPPRLVAVIR